MSTAVFSKDLRSTGELDQLMQLLRSQANDGVLPDELVSDLMVITDELLSNMLKYGNGNLLTMCIHRHPSEWRMEFVDNGDPFNPLEAERQNLDTPIEKRDIGGLGLELVIAMTDSQDYRRIDDRNHLVLTRRL